MYAVGCVDQIVGFIRYPFQRHRIRADPLDGSAQILPLRDFSGIGELVFGNIAGSHPGAQKGEGEYRQVVPAGGYANPLSPPVRIMIRQPAPDRRMKSFRRIFQHRLQNLTAVISPGPLSRKRVPVFSVLFHDIVLFHLRFPFPGPITKPEF